MEILAAKKGSVVLENARGGRFMTIRGGGSIFNGTTTIVTGFALNRQEAFQHIRTFDNKFFTYSFGENPGTVRISGIMFTIPGCGPGGDKVSRVNSQYESHRAYRRGYVSVSVGGAAFKAILMALDVNSQDSQFGLVNVTITFSTVPTET